MEVERDWRRLAWGVALILFGGLFLAERFDLLPDWAATLHWWPLIVIALGLSKLIQPRRSRDIGSFVTMTLLGLWFLFASNGYYGFSWANSWPLSLVAAGAGMVARSLASRWLGETVWSVKEEHHV